ncbi:MAG: Uncharacterised protein [Flavobacteriaceae bacterium]|jgi:hypothetical protein|nr:MAG: Uncharacterised protein [Flavobacteriaceae bacterium]|tara:strand:+ start:1464 stop:2975 length:1512 start_codon:yes stop_codon:yes gene_type:complete
MEIYYSVNQLIKKLTKQEINFLKKYLSVFVQTYGSSYETKLLLIFNAIKDNSNNNFFQIKKILPYECTNATFEKQLQRLYNKLLDCLCMDQNIKRRNQYSSRAIARLSVRKQFIQLQILLGKGLNIQSVKLLKKIISKTEKLEMFDLLSESLKYYLRINNLLQGKKGEKNILDKLNKSEINREILQKSYEYRIEINNRIAFIKVKPKSLKYFKSAIINLESAYNTTSSKEVYFNLLWIKIYVEQLQLNYYQSNLYAEQLLEFINNTPIVYQKKRLSGVLSNLAYNSLHTSQFKQAINYADETEKLIAPFSYNYYSLQDTRFHALYYSENKNLAYQLAKKLQKTKIEKTVYHQAKWNYWLAVCYFNKKEYLKAQALLDNVNALKKDKEGWNFSTRILNVVSSIQLENFIKADSQIDAIRNFYYRKQGLGARNNAFLEILLSLQDDYDYDNTYDKHKDIFNKMKEQKGWYKWEVQTPELFLFDQWFITKMDSKKYIPTYKELLSY